MVGKYRAIRLSRSAPGSNSLDQRGPFSYRSSFHGSPLPVPRWAATYPDSVGGHRNCCRHRNSPRPPPSALVWRAARTVFGDCLGWETGRLLRESAGAPRFPPRSCSVGVPRVGLGRPRRRDVPQKSKTGTAKGNDRHPEGRRQATAGAIDTGPRYQLT